ncbi:MAG: neprosin family prolyl endopeptidase [Vulcanimicrobiaceae bacterium]|jgi:hypothetical protein
MATAQLKTSAELSTWLEARQRALSVVKTTTTPRGLTLDWIPIESQVKGGTIASAPTVAAMPQRVADPQKPLALAALELDDPTVERGPAGTVPIVRPNVERLVGDVTLNDYRKKLGGVKVNKQRPGAKPTDPNPFGYFHATDNQDGTFYGTDFFLEVWDPQIDQPSAPGDDHSILQTWLQSYQNVQQSIEGGWTVDQNLNGDRSPHVFTFYTTNGYTAEGDNLGGYNRLEAGWVQYSNSVFPGIGINGASTVGGAQLGISMKFQLYREPTNGQLNWWVAVQGVWMGYYPASLFHAGSLGQNATWLGVGGEVCSTLANPAQTQDQMGSGWRAEAGWTRAALVANVRNQTDLNGTMTDNDGFATSDTATGSGTNPYDIQLHMKSGGSWGSYFYVGGPTAPAPPTATYDQVTFAIETGGDDLRGDSSATATIHFPSGAQTYTLKAQNAAGWGNNSTNTRTFTITGPAQPLAAFGAITITLTSHDGTFETPDNWNIQSLTVTALGSSGAAQVYTGSGNPLARLTGSAPSLTVH